MAAAKIRQAWEYARSCLDADSNTPWSICIVTASEEKISPEKIIHSCPDDFPVKVGLITGDYVEAKDTLSVGTMTDVKGFEFSLVLIIGCGIDFLPSPGTCIKESWREALRLYVAMTRARDEVRLYYSGKPSEFLETMIEGLYWEELKTPSSAEPAALAANKPKVTITSNLDISEKTEDLTGIKLGSLSLKGPGESVSTEIMSFDKKPVPVEQIPWKVTGPYGLELEIFINLFDNPDDKDEIGQIICHSRLGSNQAWDQVVGRLRSGIRLLENGKYEMLLRVATPKEGARASRKPVPLESLSEICGINVIEELKRLGDCEIGTRSELIGTDDRTKNWPCVVFNTDDLLTPIAAWTVVTINPLLD
ncbi:hypothetical protein N9F41_00185 [bacterium]|nr:hypothetical protein [bacterium]